MTKLPKSIRDVFARYGRIGGLKGGAKGGKATARNRTPEERRAAALRAITARWRKRSPKAKGATKARPATAKAGHAKRAR